MSTRNNKLTSGSGMHIRAKTASNFDQFATCSTSKLKQAAQKFQNEQIYKESDYIQSHLQGSNPSILSQPQIASVLDTDQTKASFINQKRGQLNQTRAKKENKRPNTN